MIDAAGALVWDRVARPFGETYALTGTAANPRRFPGQYLDPETGTHYNYFRDYDPTTGRYLQSDPIGLDGGLNTYAYVGGNPVTRIDPTGEVVQIIIARCAVGALAGGFGAANGAIARRLGRGLRDGLTAEEQLGDGADANTCRRPDGNAARLEELENLSKNILVGSAVGCISGVIGNPFPQGSNLGVSALIAALTGFGEGLIGPSDIFDGTNAPSP